MIPHFSQYVLTVHLPVLNDAAGYTNYVKCRHTRQFKQLKQFNLQMMNAPHQTPTTAYTAPASTHHLTATHANANLATWDDSAMQVNSTHSYHIRYTYYYTIEQR